MSPGQTRPWLVLSGSQHQHVEETCVACNVPDFVASPMFVASIGIHGNTWIRALACCGLQLTMCNTIHTLLLDHTAPVQQWNAFRICTSYDACVLAFFVIPCTQIAFFAFFVNPSATSGHGYHRHTRKPPSNLHRTPSAVIRIPSRRLSLSNGGAV